jgi:hypothetical protein
MWWLVSDIAVTPPYINIHGLIDVLGVQERRTYLMLPSLARAHHSHSFDG